LDLIPSFCISEVFPRPTALYLVLKHNAECSLFEPPFDVSGKRLKTPILFDSKVIHCYSLSSLGFETPGWRRVAAARQKGRVKATRRRLSFLLWPERAEKKRVCHAKTNYPTSD
jgi:hypothetical protein